MSNRTWARIVLVVFIAGLALAAYSLVTQNSNLSQTSVVFIVCGVIGYFAVMRRKKEDEAEQEEIKKKKAQRAADDVSNDSSSAANSDVSSAYDETIDSSSEPEPSAPEENDSHSEKQP